ncbi:MAG: hypothetical protein H6571_07190 [Lewinellaceae bacterium]|nr:hypothetical protein [Lewinellaceae bacterium]
MENFLIPIVSNFLSPNEILSGLKKELPKSDDYEVFLKKEDKDSMALDPVIATVIITGGIQVLTTLINGLFQVIAKKLEKESSQKTAIVKIRVDKEGMEIEFPYGMSKEEQVKLLEQTKSLASIQHISLLEK